MLRSIRPHWLFRRSQHLYANVCFKNYFLPVGNTILQQHPKVGHSRLYASSKPAKETIKKKQIEVQDTTDFEILSLTLHDLMAGIEKTSENPSVELIVPRYSQNSGSEELPIFNEIYFEPIEHEMNHLIFRLQQDIVNYNMWVVTAKPTSVDSIDVTMLPHAEGKFCMYVFTKPEYHRDFIESFHQEIGGLRYDATADGKIKVQNFKNSNLQKVVQQIKKGNMPKMAQVTTPGTQLMKRKATTPKPPATSAEAEQDILYKLSLTMEARGAEMVGGLVMQAMDQGCDLMYIDHGQKHALRLVSDQMEALIDTGYSAFVERLIANNDVLDQQFLHFPFVVLLNKKITTSSGRPSVSNISDKEGKVYIRVFTHMMWAVQHVQNMDQMASGKLNGDRERTPEEEEREYYEQKGKATKILANNKERQRKKSEEQKVEQEQEKGKEKESEDKMYSCTRLTGYQLLKMVQRGSDKLTGGLLINNGVNKEMCKVARNVTVKTEEIVDWDLDTAYASDPVYRSYQ